MHVQEAAFIVYVSLRFNNNNNSNNNNNNNNNNNKIVACECSRLSSLLGVRDVFSPVT